MRLAALLLCIYAAWPPCVLALRVRRATQRVEQDPRPAGAIERALSPVRNGTSSVFVHGECIEWDYVPRYSLVQPSACETSQGVTLSSVATVVRDGCILDDMSVQVVGGIRRTREYLRERYNVTRCGYDIECYERTPKLCEAGAASVCESSDPTAAAVTRASDATIRCDELDQLTQWLNGEGGVTPPGLCGRRLGHIEGNFDLTSPGCHGSSNYPDTCDTQLWRSWGEIDLSNAVTDKVANYDVHTHDHHFHFHWHGVTALQRSDSWTSGDNYEQVACGNTDIDTHWFRLHADNDQFGTHELAITENVDTKPYICSPDAPSGAARPKLHLKGEARGTICWKHLDMYLEGNNTNEWACDEPGSEGCCSNVSLDGYAVIDIWFRETTFYELKTGDSASRAVCNCGTVEWSD